MKLRVNRAELAQALGGATSVVAARTPKPILLCVLIETRDDNLTVACTDMDVSIRCVVRQVEIAKEGAVLVNADMFHRIVRETQDDILSMYTSGDRLHIEGEGSHFQMACAKIEDFPAISSETEDANFSLEAGVLLDLVQWTAFACARESTRYAINGVLFEIAEAGTLTLASTDGRRLSCCQTRVEKESGDRTVRAIVPSRTLSVLTKLPLRPDEAVSFSFHPNQVQIRSSSAMISSTLIEGNFPNYRDVIPKENNKHAQIQKAELFSGLRRASLLTNEESRGVRLQFDKDALTLSSRSAEQGEAVIEIPIRYEGEPIEIGFNPYFLMDPLKVMHEEHVQFSLRDAQKPGLIEGGNGFLHVVMPVNLG